MRIPWNAKKRNKWVPDQNQNYLWKQNVEIQVVLLWTHHEKRGFSGKDNNAGKGGRQQEKRKTKYKMD